MTPHCPSHEAKGFLSPGRFTKLPHNLLALSPVRRTLLETPRDVGDRQHVGFAKSQKSSYHPELSPGLGPEHTESESRVEVKGVKGPVQ